MHVCAQLGLNKRKISVHAWRWGGGLGGVAPYVSNTSADALTFRTVGRVWRQSLCRREESVEDRRILGYEQLRSCLAFVVCGVVGRSGGGACTPSAFLYAAMTALSRAVSPHQQPSILIAQPKSRSKRSILQITGRTRGAPGSVASPCCAANAALRAER